MNNFEIGFFDELDKQSQINSKLLLYLLGGGIGLSLLVPTILRNIRSILPYYLGSKAVDVLRRPVIHYNITAGQPIPNLPTPQYANDVSTQNLLYAIGAMQ